jgi:uncharacterized membrane protein YhaH (DUF805 family)
MNHNPDVAALIRATLGCLKNSVSNQICRRPDQSRHPRGRPWRGCDELQKILFSFEGRIGRGTYWLAILGLIVAVLVLTFAPFLLNSEAAAVLMLALTSQFVWLLSLWPILAVGAKRLHDRNKNGWWLLVFWLLPFALFLWRLQHRPL